jgi:hypothetical protein
MSTNKKFVSLFWRDEKHQGEGNMEVSASLEGCEAKTRTIDRVLQGSISRN